MKCARLLCPCCISCCPPAPPAEIPAIGAPLIRPARAPAAMHKDRLTSWRNAQKAAAQATAHGGPVLELRALLRRPLPAAVRRPSATASRSRTRWPPYRPPSSAARRSTSPRSSNNSAGPSMPTPSSCSASATTSPVSTPSMNGPAAASLRSPPSRMTSTRPASRGGCPGSRPTRTSSSRT